MYNKKQKQEKNLNSPSASSSSQLNTPRTMHRMSKAERYRWIFKDSASKNTSQNTVVTSQSSGTGIANNGSLHQIKDQLVENSKINLDNHLHELGSTSKGSSSNSMGIGFTCKHCQTSFKSITDLTVHMNSTGHFKPSSINSGLMNSSPSANMHNVNKLDGPKLSTGMPLSNNPLALQNTLKNFFGLAAIRNKQMQSNTFNQYGSFGYSGALFNPLLAREPSVTSSNPGVLLCIKCSESFDSLQDLSVHMIKTRHFEEFNQKSATAGSSDRDHKKNNSVANIMSSENRIKETDKLPVVKKTLKRPKMGFTIADLLAEETESKRSKLNDTDEDRPITPEMLMAMVGGDGRYEDVQHTTCKTRKTSLTSTVNNDAGGDYFAKFIDELKQTQNTSRNGAISGKHGGSFNQFNSPFNQMQLTSQVYSQLNSQINSQFYTQLNSQSTSKLDQNLLNPQLGQQQNTACQNDNTQLHFTMPPESNLSHLGSNSQTSPQNNSVLSLCNLKEKK